MTLNNKTSLLSAIEDFNNLFENFKIPFKKWSLILKCLVVKLLFIEKKSISMKKMSINEVTTKLLSLVKPNYCKKVVFSHRFICQRCFSNEKVGNQKS